MSERYEATRIFLRPLEETDIDERYVGWFADGDVTRFIQSRNFRSFEVYLVATAVYFVLTVALRQAFALVGHRAFRRR